MMSFIFYSLFRTFLITFTFAYLADSLGFHYFGVLAGVVFVISGFAGLLQYPLRLLVSGTCYKETISSSSSSSSVDSDCNNGQWKLVNLVMLVSFVALLSFSYRDYLRRIKTKLNSRAVVSFHSFSSLNEYARLLPPVPSQSQQSQSQSQSHTKSEGGGGGGGVSYQSIHT